MYHLAVTKDYRLRGVGTALMDDLYAYGEDLTSN